MRRSRSSAISGETGIGLSKVTLGKPHARVSRPVAERQVLGAGTRRPCRRPGSRAVVHEDELGGRLLAVRGLRRGGRGSHDHPLRGRSVQPAWSLGMPRSRRGTFGRRRSVGRAWARNRRRESRLRRRGLPRRGRCWREPGTGRSSTVSETSSGMHRLRARAVGMLIDWRERPLDRALAAERAAVTLDMRFELGAVLAEVVETGYTAKSPSAQSDFPSMRSQTSSRSRSAESPVLPRAVRS